jgi:hypothetical protein
MGVFSFLFHQKNMSFGLSFCRMKLNAMQNFWQKGIHSLFWILTPKRPKKSKSQEALTHLMKNLTFWMELNTPMKILAFCISSFQSN